MKFKILPLLTSLSLTLGSIASGDEYPEVMFILDSSGSMAEEIGGKKKIDVAKEVMHKIVPDLDPKVHIGLTAYGHRRPGDCNDIEILIQAGSANRSELLGQVDLLQPKGRTPISAAILAVTNKLQLKDAETTIVLVSDGIETCGGNPCDVVKQLKSTGIKFVTHVIGFDVSQEAAEQLKCTAEAGGGQYFSASDSNQLLDALKKVSAEVQEKVKQVDPAKIAKRRATTGLGKLKVTMPIGSEISLAHLQIDRPDGEKYRIISKPKPNGTYPLPSGSYRVTLGFATPSYGQPTITNLGELNIVGKETKELKLGSVSFNVPEKLTKAMAVESVLITDAGTNEVVATVRKNGNSYYHFKPKPVIAGVYNIQFLYSVNSRGPATTVARNIAIEPGKDAVATLDSAFQLKKADDVIAWELTPSNTSSQIGPESAHAQEVALSVGVGGINQKSRLWIPYVVPPGTYDLKIYMKGMDEALPAAEGIELNAGDLLEFDAGI